MMGLILSRTVRIHSDIPPTPPLIFNGVKILNRFQTT